MRINSVNKTFLSKPIALHHPPEQPGCCRMPGAALSRELASPQPKSCSRFPVLPSPAMLVPPTSPKNPPGSTRTLQWGLISFGLLCKNVRYCLADTLGSFLDVNEGQIETGTVWAALICSVELFDYFFFPLLYWAKITNNSQRYEAVAAFYWAGWAGGAQEVAWEGKSRLETGKWGISVTPDTARREKEAVNCQCKSQTLNVQDVMRMGHRITGTGRAGTLTGFQWCKIFTLPVRLAPVIKNIP